MHAKQIDAQTNPGEVTKKNIVSIKHISFFLGHTVADVLNVHSGICHGQDMNDMCSTVKICENLTLSTEFQVLLRLPLDGSCRCEFVLSSQPWRLDVKHIQV